MLPLGRDRRIKQGRKINPNKPPKDTTIKVYKETREKIKHLWPYHQMPMGDRLDAILKHYEQMKEMINNSL